MDSLLIAFLIGILVSLVSVLGDVFVKEASLASQFTGWKLLLIGALIYALTAFGWFFAMRYVKLATLGVIFSVTVVVAVTLVSIFYFKEKLSVPEIGAVIMALASLAILYRFA